MCLIFRILHLDGAVTFQGKWIFLMICESPRFSLFLFLANIYSLAVDTQTIPLVGV